jgi:CHASE2 domain-containing sensor protein
VLILTISISASLLLTRPPSPLAAVDLLAQAIAVWFQPIAGQADATEIVVVGITESTLARLPYRSPIDRGFLANLVESLEAAKVREIGLDIVFDRPTESAKDARLRAVLEAASMPIVVASVAPDTQLAPAQRNDLTRFLDGLTIGDANLARDRFDDVVRTHVPFHPMTGRPSFPVALAQALNVAVPTNPFPVQ